MTKPIPTKTGLDTLVAEVGAHADGAGIEALSNALAASATRRTLQRKLAALVADQRLIAEGSGRARRYRVPPTTASLKATSEPVTTRATNESYVPLTDEGRATRDAVRRPLHARKPVSYDLAFLEAYEPNRTHYLPEPLREQLHALGRSSVVDVAPAGTFARDILNRLLIDLSWASSRLEGNTYTRLDTERLIELGHAAEGKDAFETQMILNHKAAIDYLVHEPSVKVDTHSILALHALLSDGLLRDPAAGGRVRRRAVEISASVYRPIAMPQRLEELFDIVMRTAAEVDDPFEQAFFLMVHLPYLQPFEDVNKRVSRLTANIPLMRLNLSPLSFIDVPVQAYVEGTLGVYELTRVDLLRDVFVWAYERSCQQYNAVRQQLVPPDTFRLRHRAQLSAAMKAIVQSGLRPGERAFAKAIPADMARADRERFDALLRAELDTLHVGNAVRFGLRPLEVQAWQAPRVRAAATPRRQGATTKGRPVKRSVKRTASR